MVASDRVERTIEEHREWIAEARKKTYESQKRRADFYNQLPLKTREQADDALRRLKALIEPMVESHSKEMGVKPSAVHYKAMISRWGVCNVRDKYESWAKMVWQPSAWPAIFILSCS